MRFLAPWATLVAIVGACSTPADPAIPPLDAPDAGDTDTGPPPVTTCVGASDGANCGSGKICVSSACLDPACGDGVVTPPEECDKGSANAPGAGCEPGCTFTCSDARPCAAADPCVAAATCDAQRHVCVQGGPAPPGTTCGNYKLCEGGQCVDGVCGDGITTPPEACDNGSANGPGKGCETTCKYTCSNAAADCAPVPCNLAACSAQHTCATTPDASKNGQACASGLVCNNGACIAPGAVCGNGVKEGGEDCDFGAQNGPGTGCEMTCKFSCATAASCIDQNACDQPPTCQPVTVNGMTGQKCVNGAPKADGASCGVGSICMGNACKPSVCGDGFRDGAKNEDCDDGNTTNLDGCDAVCKFEQDQRVIGMKVQFGTDTYCAVNALGGAIAGSAQQNFQTNVDQSIADGSLSAMFKFVGDPTGASGAVTVGSMSGAPVAGGGYSGTSDLDWWYTVDPNAIDGSRNALAQLTGSYSGGAVDMAGTLNLIMTIGGSLAVLHVSGAKIHGPIGALSIPKTSSGAPPGHLASEHLSPTLQSYATSGNTASSPSAEMCGNVSANSLANTAVPATLLPGGGTPCTEGYTSANRALDVFVNGCHVKVLLVTVTAIKPTQPDEVDPSMPAAGAGGPYVLSVDPSTKRVNQCKDKSGAVVTLSTCLGAAAYSSFFKFATDRVIIK
jgi:cysteine-rich repeat protein